MRTTPIQTQSNTTAATKQTPTSEPCNTTTSTQTPNKSTVTNICVSRVDPTICVQEERTHNIEPPTMGSTTLEASYEMITEELVATVEEATKTVQSEEDTPLFRQRLQRVWRSIHRRSHQERSKPSPLINFVKKRDW